MFPTPVARACLVAIMAVCALAFGTFANRADQPAEAANCAGPCLRIDAIPGGGIDESASVGSTFSVDIVAQNLPQMGLFAFNFVVLYDATVLSAQPPTGPAGFSCTPPDPSGDLPEDSSQADGDPATGDAFLSCFMPDAHLGNGPIARINFTSLRAGSSQLRFINVSAGGMDGIETLSCNPVISTAGECYGATVSTTGGGTPPPPPPPPPVGANQCLVSFALDGETVRCADGSHVRFIGVGSPLGADAGAGWATAVTNWFLSGKVITLEYDTTMTDQFGQRYAYPHVTGTDGNDYNISVLLIYVGMAVHYPDNVNNKYRDWLGAAEVWARTACWNLWDGGNPLAHISGCS
jgi:endonuclease YncB( thermonuclease family)